jgi:hypothetical protein
MATITTEQRIADLLAWAAEEGITLPYPASMIIALEDSGAVVDFHSGAITPGAADHRYSLTVVGEAVAVALGAGAGEL